MAAQSNSVSAYSTSSCAISTKKDPAELGELLATEFSRTRRDSRTGAEVVELGRRLSILRESLPRGQFTKTIIGLGLDSRNARKMVQAAVIFSDYPRLVGKVTSQSQLFSLMALDEAALSKLELGETIHGINLENIDHLMVKEIRAALKGSLTNASTSMQSPATPPEVAPILGAAPAIKTPKKEAETYPSVYSLVPGKFNGCALSILQHEGRAWLILEEVAAVVGDTPEKVSEIEATLGWFFDSNFPSGHYAKVRLASTSLTARILDTRAVCFLEEALGAEFVQWFSGQCSAVDPVNTPEAKPEEPQRADYLDQLRELHYELYNMKSLIASQAKAIQVMGDDLQDEKVYPLVDLAKIAIGLTEQFDTLLDRHDEVLTRLRTRLLKKPGADDTLPESVWLGLVAELSAEREVWGNEDMWRLSQHADCLSRYAGRSPEASAAILHLKAFAARHGAFLYDHLYEGEAPGEGRMAFT